MQLQSLIDSMAEIAPLKYAEPWDNVGLLAGDPSQVVSRVLLTIDYTKQVADEAIASGCDGVIAYHPPLFHAVKRINAGSLIFDAIRRGIAIYSPHTAWDVAEGGTNDLLADILNLQDRQPLRQTEGRLAQCKLITFVPESALEDVSRALFTAGAGNIGDYTCCSFRTAGTGTFRGEECKTHPTVGQAGKLEQAAEIRLETIVPLNRIEPVLKALRDAHPYEEPAFDLSQLVTPPEHRGVGRVGEMTPTPRAALFAAIKEALGVDRLLVSGPRDGTLTRAAVCAGAGDELLDDALAKHVGLYLTGEIRHHDAIKAAAAGVTVVCALHSNSERPSLIRLRDRLTTALPGLPVLLSQQDRDPFLIQ